MMRDRTPYTSDELAEMADQCEDFCPRRAATFRELIVRRSFMEKHPKENADSKHKDEEISE